jgi:hypothetical protein
MLNLLLKGVAMCAPPPLLVWGVCWWGRSPRWILGLSLLAAGLVSYLLCSRWQLVTPGETREDGSEVTGAIEDLGVSGSRIRTGVLAGSVAAGKEKKGLTAVLSRAGRVDQASPASLRNRDPMPRVAVWWRIFAPLQVHGRPSCPREGGHGGTRKTMEAHRGTRSPGTAFGFPS